MQPEQTPHHRPQEQRDSDGYAQDLRERLQSGLLSELTAYPILPSAVHSAVAVGLQSQLTLTHNPSR
ncbi:MAG TPA: hypothetical protein VF026_13955 [Ktedonobacteraceae bacterium]